MRARAHGPTAAAETRMCMLRYTEAPRQAPHMPPCAYGDVGVTRSVNICKPKYQCTGPRSFLVRLFIERSIKG